MVENRERQKPKVAEVSIAYVVDSGKGLHDVAHLS